MYKTTSHVCRRRRPPRRHHARNFSTHSQLRILAEAKCSFFRFLRYREQFPSLPSNHRPCKYATTSCLTKTECCTYEFGTSRSAAGYEAGSGHLWCDKEHARGGSSAGEAGIIAVVASLHSVVLSNWSSRPHGHSKTARVA
jgi:hypothetical protein